MSSNTVVASNFNTQKLTFSQLKVLDNGGKQAYANYENGTFVFQTPNCYLPYGMNAFDKAGPVKYSVEMSLRGFEEAGSKMKPFHDALSRLDEFMIDQGVKNSKQWFKSEMSRDVIKAFYSPVIRLAKDREGNPKPYPPTVKLSLRQKRDSQEFDVVCFDDKRVQYKGIPLEELLVKGAQVTCLIQCTGLWFAGMKYGLSWKLSQAIVTSLPQSSRNLAFVDSELDVVEVKTATKKTPVIVDEETAEASDDGEDEAFSAPPPKKSSVVAAMLPKTPAAAEPDEEDDDADDAEPVPVPKKTNTVIKKKVIAKK